MKLAAIVGARPQFIKAAMVSRALQAFAGTEEVLIHTGQHYDENMSDVFFEELEISRPEYYLGIGSGSHGAQTGRMLEAVEKVLQDVRPEWVLVYGDTNSTLAGALAAVKLHVPLAHVEAGLRSFNRRMPEEINRVLTDHAADLLFPPTDAAVNNLRHEGVNEDRIHRVGDVMYDATLYYAGRAGEKSPILDRLKLQPQEYILATVHRAENTEEMDRLRAILEGLAHISEQIPVVLPLHPRTRAVLEHQHLMGDKRRALLVIEPVGYLDMAKLEKNARLVATDSGGVQKEAFFYKVPCVTLREETEWVELVELGWNHVVPPKSTDLVVDGIRHGLSMKGKPGAPYGNGAAADRIAAILRGAQS